ncbi:type 11 methyltransferase [Salinarchaeum sp. Harcht-Bsk1]|uniref:methyltransferase domain-containing protein n=1 Tax=Salinarchaeum sp. Harcht-Bsk1 TaxID=1333523 RepID=UPI0003422C5D|nr:methyltransferase domain-containing protein [Salinarchaeum sp. Harcht-Bsk1]AGN00846.1 type 11 methyltransferase [Salinarchaeum sp. Harcht-Bsk1]
MTTLPEPDVSNETVVATYHRLAAVYDWFVTPLEMGTRQRALELLAIERGDHVVEVGCGPGHALVALAERVGPDGYVVGLDAAAGMVRLARRRAIRRGATAQVDVCLGDARSLPFRSNVVDVAFIEDTLELFADDEMRTVLAELERVLRPDGRLCVVTMERAGAEDDPFVRAYDWFFERVPGYDRFGCRPIYAARMLEEAGFEVERRERLRRAWVWPVEVLIARPV